MTPSHSPSVSATAAYRFQAGLVTRIYAITVFGVCGSVVVPKLVAQGLRDGDKELLWYAGFMGVGSIWFLARTFVRRIDFEPVRIERRNIFGRISSIDYPVIEKLERTARQLKLSGRYMSVVVIPADQGDLKQMTEIIRERHPHTDKLEVVVDEPVLFQELGLDK